LGAPSLKGPLDLVRLIVSETSYYIVSFQLSRFSSSKVSLSSLKISFGGHFDIHQLFAILMKNYAQDPQIWSN